MEGPGEGRAAHFCSLITPSKWCPVGVSHSTVSFNNVRTCLWSLTLKVSPKLELHDDSKMSVARGHRSNVGLVGKACQARLNIFPGFEHLVDIIFDRVYLRGKTEKGPGARTGVCYFLSAVNGWDFERRRWYHVCIFYSVSFGGCCTPSMLLSN